MIVDRALVILVNLLSFVGQLMLDASLVIVVLDGSRFQS